MLKKLMLRPPTTSLAPWQTSPQECSLSLLWPLAPTNLLQITKSFPHQVHLDMQQLAINLNSRADSQRLVRRPLRTSLSKTFLRKESRLTTKSAAKTWSSPTRSKCATPSNVLSTVLTFTKIFVSRKKSSESKLTTSSQSKSRQKSRTLLALS